MSEIQMSEIQTFLFGFQTRLWNVWNPDAFVWISKIEKICSWKLNRYWVSEIHTLPVLLINDRLSPKIQKIDTSFDPKTFVPCPDSICFIFTQVYLKSQKSQKNVESFYSRAPKSDRSDFGAFTFGSVVKSFGFRTRMKSKWLFL